MMINKKFNILNPIKRGKLEMIDEKYLELLKERFEASDKRFEELLKRSDEKEENYNKKFEKLLQKSEENMEKIKNSITEQHESTRQMIRKRYDAFGELIILMTALLSGIYVSQILEPLVESKLSALAGLVFSVILGVVIYNIYDSRRGKH